MHNCFYWTFFSFSIVFFPQKYVLFSSVLVVCCCYNSRILSLAIIFVWQLKVVFNVSFFTHRIRVCISLLLFFCCCLLNHSIAYHCNISCLAGRWLKPSAKRIIWLIWWTTISPRGIASSTFWTTRSRGENLTLCWRRSSASSPWQMCSPMPGLSRTTEVKIKVLPDYLIVEGPKIYNIHIYLICFAYNHVLKYCINVISFDGPQIPSFVTLKRLSDD